MLHKDRPLDWTNISLGEYIELQDITLDSGDEQEDIVMQQIQILYNRNPYTLTMPEFRKCVDGLRFMSKPMPNMKVKDEYWLNGSKYYLHKKLNDFKVAQYIDYEQIMKSNKGVDAYAEFIALFLMPEPDCDYGDGYAVDAVVKDITKYMSIADAYAIATFFLRLSKAYIIHFLLYSHRMTMKVMKNKKRKRELRKKTRQMIRTILAGALRL